MAPLVTVIVPAYNYGHLISQTIGNVQNQTYEEWECIVVDDGSTDHTKALVSEYANRDPRIRYICQTNQKQAAAKNNGIRNSLGKYIQFLDADDLIESEKLARQVEYLESHDAVDIAYGQVRYFHDGSPRQRLYSMFPENAEWMPKLSGTGAALLHFLKSENMMAVNCPLLRKSVFERVGLFDENLSPLEDWEMWIRAAAGGQYFQFVDRPGCLALVRVHETSSSRDKFSMCAARVLVRRKLERFLTPQFLPYVDRSVRASAEVHFAIEALADHRRLAAMWKLLRAGFFEPRLKSRAKWLALCAAASFTNDRHVRKYAKSPWTKRVRSLHPTERSESYGLSLLSK
ncbi:MAG TPA: glycosyltransferase [Pyrinomonadaceae bacterium]|nr:glycosyltransferase [Pyrinomonadaceae bacterium]